jgi:hypothetical protein
VRVRVARVPLQLRRSAEHREALLQALRLAAREVLRVEVVLGGCGSNTTPPPSRNAEFRGSFAENLNQDAFLQPLWACVQPRAM